MHEENLIKLSPINSKEAARRNITKKVDILETWLRDGIPWEYANGQPLRDDDGCRICVYFPTSLRSFNAWCSEKYPIDTMNRLKIVCEISGNGVDTLNKYLDLKTRVQSLMQALIKTSLKQKEAEGPNRITVLEMEIERLNLFINNQAAKLIEFQRSNIILSKNMSAIERREKGNFDELAKSYKSLENQNSRLREEIALLTKQLKNVHSLKEVMGEK